ncbi:hypothetical protein KP509_25G045500 [Ceratopteris richardii]|uniref:Uncharacterized protein n=1 Tax=Ceratopteris richardii TaxID=49495 RepID=A0A8T2RSI7_CERRI|nr:hypothetical protein KP509_25G045500 [Ceratopteris richardii]
MEYLQDSTLFAARDMYLARVLDMGQQTQFDTEFIMYSSSMGSAYSRPIASQRDFCKFPVNWWQMYGYNIPIVSKVTLRVLSQVFIMFDNCLKFNFKLGYSLMEFPLMLFTKGVLF